MKKVNAVGDGVFNSETPLSAILKQGDVCDLIGFEDRIHFVIVDIVEERVNLFDSGEVIGLRLSLAEASNIAHQRVGRAGENTRVHTPYHWSFQGTRLIDLVPDKSQIVTKPDFAPVDRAERREFNKRISHLPPAEQRRLFEERFLNA